VSDLFGCGSSALGFALVIGIGASPVLGCHPAVAGASSIRAPCWTTNKMLRSMTFSFYFCKHQQKKVNEGRRRQWLLKIK
jgi:hypothetical protein